MPESTTPDGYMRNDKGHLVPSDAVSEHDRLRDEIVRGLVRSAQRHQYELRDFKREAMDDVDTFVELSSERYNVHLGGERGNLTLQSFDGKYRIQVAVSDRLVFDERIHAAKKIIDECIHRWAKDSNKEIRALVEHAFQTDKEGNINKRRVLALTQLDIEDERWQEGMQAIKDSLKTDSTATYIRFYERDERGRYQMISLDIAAL